MRACTERAVHPVGYATLDIGTTSTFTWVPTKGHTTKTKASSSAKQAIVDLKFRSTRGHTKPARGKFVSKTQETSINHRVSTLDEICILAVDQLGHNHLLKIQHRIRTILC